MSMQRLFPLLIFSGLCLAQDSARSKPAERTFAASVSEVQAAVNKLQPTLSGRLPTLDGFVGQPGKSLEHYRRGYYQCSVQVTASSRGSLVRLTAKVTAWHEDPPHSRYEVLQSNGRLESDLLDRLQESLAPKAANTKPERAPDISAPMPQLPNRTANRSSDASSPDSPLREEARSLEEVLRNQSHPTNLVAVKQSQTPVLEGARADAHVLFLASAEDEFEVLDVNPEWVHVRISGLSRGWLRRASVEILYGTESSRNETLPHAESADPAAAAASSLFSISSEEVGAFPGSWDALKGKTARIISVQQAAGSGRITSPQDKLYFAASVFRKEALPAGVDGLVLIFDAEDGGMVASGREALDQWRHGSISEASFWKQCFLDPPEILGNTN